MAGKCAMLLRSSRSLRYDSIDKENAYVRAKADSLRRMVIFVTSVAIFMFVLMGIAILLSDRTWRPPASDIERTLLGLWYGAAISAFLTVASAFAAAYWNLLGAHGLETLAVIGVSLMAILTPFVSLSILSRLLGLGPEELPGRSFALADTTFLLYMDLIVTAAHIALPVRWFKLVPFAGTSILVYAAFSPYSSAPLAALFATLGFAALVLFASAGKRTAEIQERLNFGMVLAEKQKRFEAEHRLSQRQSATANHVYQDQASQAAKEGSLCSTTPTGKVFALSDEDGLPASFEQIKEVGLHEQWLISSEDLAVLPSQFLGAGAFGVVVRALFLGSEVAVKTAKATPTMQDSDVRQLCNELRLLRRLRHPNVVCIYGAYVDTDCKSVGLVMELLHGQTFEDTILEGPLSLTRVQLLVDAASALAFLHSRQPRVIHGDLKASNFFAESCPLRTPSQVRGKLLDFGLANTLTKRAQVRGGTSRYMAPELFGSPQHPRPPADVFALGRLIYFAVCGVQPNMQSSEYRIGKALRAGAAVPLTWPQKNATVLAPSHRFLVEMCCQDQADARPSIEQVQHHLLFAAKDAFGECHLEGLRDLEERFSAWTDAGVGLSSARDAFADRCCPSRHDLEGSKIQVPHPRGLAAMDTLEHEAPSDLAVDVDAASVPPSDPMLSDIDMHQDTSSLLTSNFRQLIRL